MAPPKRSSFSVSVVLPASGCEMIAKVRRRATGLGSVIIFELWGRSALYLVRLRPQGKPGDDSCVPMRLERQAGWLAPAARRSRRMDSRRLSDRRTVESEFVHPDSIVRSRRNGL